MVYDFNPLTTLNAFANRVDFNSISGDNAGRNSGGLTLTKKRYFVVAGMMASLLGAGLLIASMVPPSPGVSKANFDRIEKGMKLTDVEAILGKDPFTLRERGIDFLHIWIDDDNGACACVSFLDNIVIDKDWTDSNETIIDKLRRWLRL